jgi:hypothetical protein
MLRLTRLTVSRSTHSLGSVVLLLQRHRVRDRQTHAVSTLVPGANLLPEKASAKGATEALIELQHLCFAWAPETSLFMSIEKTCCVHWELAKTSKLESMEQRSKEAARKKTPWISTELMSNMDHESVNHTTDQRRDNRHCNPRQ